MNVTFCTKKFNFFFATQFFLHLSNDFQIKPSLPFLNGNREIVAKKSCYIHRHLRSFAFENCRSWPTLREQNDVKQAE